MRRLKHDFWRHPGLICFCPAGRAEAPSIARLQAWKLKFRPRGGEVIASRFRESQKVLGDAGTYRVHAAIHWPGITTAIAEETGHGICAASLKFSPKDVSCWCAVKHVLDMAHSA